MAIYPSRPAARDRFVLERRGGRASPDPWRPQGVIVEDEVAADGRVQRVGTVFLTGRECPWRCVMCDLWKGTIAEDTPRGAIPAQLAAAREQLRRQQQDPPVMKLYNAGSFFDPRAVPEADYPAIAAHLDGLERVVVESHPALVGPRVDRLLERLALLPSGAPRLEVAMGLETAHPAALERLNKRMTVAGFRTAAGHLTRRGIDIRVFLLIAPPFVPPDERDEWLLRSVDVALACGAAVISLVPLRSGNGAMEALVQEGLASEPDLEDVERALDVVQARRGRHAARIFVDTWDLERTARCAACAGPRRARLHEMNLQQRVLPAVACDRCRPAGG